MGQNEDHEPENDPDAATATVATRLTTLPPVQKVADLPKAAEENTICYVHEKGTSFLFADGRWGSGGNKVER
jgi:hypothetical protein